MTSRKDGEEPLKAVVFADDCGASSATPFSCTRRLLNVPILSWQLATLARYGVKEAIILSSKPVESPWEDSLERMKVTSLSSESWTSEGDAIRELEAHDGLRPVDDFVLVRQGTVFNVDVKRLVTEHKRRKEADRNWLITATFRKGAGSASTGLVVGVDRTTGTLASYVEGIDEGGISIDVHAENVGLQNGGTFEICSDVIDVGLDVCAPDFLLEFRENFYYDKVRAYIKEKLEGGEAEVFGNRMYAHFLNSRAGQYGARIHSLASLMQTTSDILSGWMTPIGISMITGKRTETKVPSYQSEYLMENSILGTDSSVAVGSTILESVIGDNVKIGSDVTIRQCILLDNAVVRDRCELNKSIVGAGCVVEDSARVENNCYIDDGVVIGAELEMQPNSLITLQDPKAFQRVDEDEDDERDDEDGDEPGMNGVTSSVSNGVADIEAQDDDSTWLEEHVGVGGKGRLLDAQISRNIDPFFGWKEFKESFYFEDEEEDELEEDDLEYGDELIENVEDDINGEVDKLSTEVAVASIGDDVGEHAENDDTRIERFNQEIVETIERAFAENVDVDNTALEVNSLKLAFNCSFAETLTGLAVGLASAANKSSEPDQLYASIDSALETYKPLVSKFVKEDDATHHVHVASGLASALGSQGTLLMYLYKAMYEKDMLDEDGILTWASAERQRIESGTGNEELLTTLSPLIDWLEDSEEEED